MVRDAILSDDGKYRYMLSRAWAAGDRVLFVMLKKLQEASMWANEGLRLE